MTKKHFKSIANAIKFSSIYSNNSTRRIIIKDMLIDELCAMFELWNKNFDKDKFIDACNK